MLRLPTPVASALLWGEFAFALVICLMCSHTSERAGPCLSET